MNISLNWLKRYIDLDLEINDLSEILTDIGLEVEGVEKIETIKGGLRGIVVGHVVECGKHPGADKLSLTKVNVGELELLQIVCGAPNVAQGQKVLVSTIGTTLYDAKGEPFKIKKGKIRGEVSEGMICAADELGLGDDHSGIMVLPEEVPVGTLARDYFKVEDDYVFDIGLTPNRSDATSHLGTAKDLAAYLKINRGWTGSIKDPDVSRFNVEVDNPPLEIEIEDEIGCPRYTGITLKNVVVGDSPAWMQNHLNAIGVRPINNVVDITNFILHELGQPLHAFDATKIKDGKVKIKTLPEGTPFVSLDEKERKLQGTDLMICDGQDKPMCIAGVFGGIDSGVTDATTDIFLESAHFNAGYIRKTSTKHLLRTDAAKVFEKGSDPNLTKYALKRASLLLQEHASATIHSNIVDVYPAKIEPREIIVRYSKVNKVIGTPLEKEEVHNILRAMDMELQPMDDDSFKVLVPTNKADVLREIDIIEEILRIYGFNKVPIPSQLKTAINYQNYPTKRQIQNGLADYLAHNGFNEMMGMSLIESHKYVSKDDSFVYINNTSNIHLDIMRPDAMISGLKSVAHNLNYQQSDLKLFEFGRSYKALEEGFEEREFLSLFITGQDSVASWDKKATSTDFFTMKKWVERLLAKANIKTYQVKEIEAGPFNEGLLYHRGPNDIVRFGAISRATLKKAEISAPVYYAEFDYKALSKSAGKSSMTVAEISKYPGTERDLSLVINNNVAFQDILAISYKTDKKLLKEVSLFDIYRNDEQLGQGKKAYAVKFKFQDLKKTLVDKEIEKIMKTLISKFENEIGAQIRS